MAPSPSDRIRLGFAGTPEFAAVILGALLEHHDVGVVYCQPARPTGRGQKITPSPVEILAQSRGLPVRTPKTLRGEAAILADHHLDVLIVAAYGLILPASILGVPPRGCLNVHASLLPRWRGAAPIERAMMAGDRTTGVSIMQMDKGLDTGPVLSRLECAIRPDDTGDSLRERLATLGAHAVVDCLARLDDLEPKAQSDVGVTYAAKLQPADSAIHWDASAIDLANRIRALHSRQPAFCLAQNERVRLLFAEAVDADTLAPPGTVVTLDRTGLVVACGEGRLRITRVALARGKGKPMDIASLISGYTELIRPGQVLGTST